MEEVVQDGMALAFALAAMVLSVAIVEWSLARGHTRWGKHALQGLLISFVCIYLVSEVAGWLLAFWLHVVRNVAYGRVFSFAAFGLLLYVPTRIYQLMQMRHVESAALAAGEEAGAGGGEEEETP